MVVAMGPRLARFVDFDIDHYLDPYIPSPRLSRLPRPISRFLGYRDEVYKEKPILVICIWSFVGALSSLLIIGALYRYAPGLSKYNPPVIVASMGASAILDFSAIRAPLAQPRNALLGQTFSAVIGVAITKGFQRSNDFENLQWIAGAVCCAASSFVMSITGTVHPPGGATAILAATNTSVIKMGWIFVPFIMLSSSVMLTVALAINNIQRCYPVYWWTAHDLGNKRGLDLEKVDSGNSTDGLREKEEDEDDDDSVGRARSASGSVDTTIVIDPHRTHWPQSLELSEEEVYLLQQLQGRLLRSGSALDASPSLPASG